MMAGKSEWHGKVLSPEQFHKAEHWLPNLPLSFQPTMATSLSHVVHLPKKPTGRVPIEVSEIPIAPRIAAAKMLERIARHDPRIMVLDPEVGNSTGVHPIETGLPRQFVQGYIAESLVAGLVTGFAHRGYIPVAATFGAFWTRAHDQLRMSAYDGSHQVIIGTHAGVHIGEDGASQMALEDIAMFRSLPQSTVFAAADDVAAQRLLQVAVDGNGMHYLRLTRAPLPRLYDQKTKFFRGGSHTLQRSVNDWVTIVAHGVTVSEALRATRGISGVRIIDAYSIAPLDKKTLQTAASQTGKVLVVEDHRQAGGLGEAVATVVSGLAKVKILAVQNIPHSATPAQALAQAGIDHHSIRRALQSWKS
jgi:transketolase